MEVGKGYKQTELGTIPEDWEVNVLDELTIKIGSGITPTGGETVYKEDGRPFVRSQNIGWGQLILDDIAFIDDETHQTFPNTEIKLNDVFLNISGASIGRSSYANKMLIGGNVNQHVCIIRVIAEKINPIYLNLFLLSRNGQKQIDSLQSGGNRQGLNIGQIKNFKIPLPSTKSEQTAIATALSDADALITSLEKLIEKKRAIKQGAMQELLKPKEGWAFEKIKNIASITTGAKNTQDKIDDGFYSFFVRSDKIERINTYSFDGEAILVAGDGVGTGKVVNYYNGKFDFHQRVYKISDFHNGIYGFYFYLYFKNNFFNRVMQMTAKSSVDSVRMEMISEMIIHFPLIEEQIRIANLLSDMDAEITALEQKLGKYKLIKQGMMQELLTGRIRLVESV